MMFDLLSDVKVFLCFVERKMVVIIRMIGIVVIRILFVVIFESF